MALVAKRSRRTTIFIISLVVVVVAALGYFLISKFFTGVDDTTDSAAIGVRDLVITNSFGEEVLTDPRFTPLRVYGPPPGDVDLDTVGRPNPFAPLP